MAAHFLSAAKPADKKVFTRLLGKKAITKSEVHKAIALYEKYSSIAHAKVLADAYLEMSKEALNKLPASDARTNLSTVAGFLVSRSF